jgi:hypothetical protein
MITSRRSPKISGIAELAVHLPSPAIESALGDLADQDCASEVRHVALIALEGHHRESSVRALLAAFPSAARDDSGACWPRSWKQPIHICLPTAGINCGLAEFLPTNYRVRLNTMPTRD